MVRFPIVRGLVALALVGVPSGLVSQGAMARSFTRSFTTNSGKTFTQTVTTNFSRTTNTATRTETLTRPNGTMATASASRTPDGKGGLTVTHSFTGFNGQTHTSTHTFGR